MDWHLPGGQALSTLEVEDSGMKSPMDHQIVRVHTSLEMWPSYRAKCVYIDNVTGIILTGSELTTWNGLTPTNKWCSLGFVVDFQLQDLGEFPTVRMVGENPHGVYP